MTVAGEPAQEDNTPDNWGDGSLMREVKDGDPLVAIAAYRRALRADRTDGDAWFGLGRAFARLGRVGEAIRALRRAVVSDPDDPARRFTLAQLLASNQGWRDAVASFTEVICLAPGYWAAHHNLGICCEQLGSFPRAESALAMATALAPDLWEAQITLGRLRQALGLWEKSYEPLVAALRLKPLDWNGHFALGFSRGHSIEWQRDGRALARAVKCQTIGGGELITDFVEISTLGSQDGVKSDCSILIPFGIDVPERVENIETVVDHMARTLPGVVIHVFEAGATRHVPERPGLRYRREDSTPGRFSRTKLCNRMAHDATTRVIVLYDADVLIPAEQMRTAITLARDGIVDLVLAYDGRCIELNRAAIPEIKAGAPISAWHRHWHSIRSSSIGGVCVWNRASFMAAGMENEAFENWGGEDAERLQRALKLGMRVARVEGPIYHLNHPRRGGPPDPAVARAKEAAFAQLQSMSPEALRAHVAAWPWVRQAKT